MIIHEGKLVHEDPEMQGSWEWALSKLREWKGVRRSVWVKERVLYTNVSCPISSGVILDFFSWRPVTMTLYDYIATDWEIDPRVNPSTHPSLIDPVERETVAEMLAQDIESVTQRNISIPSSLALDDVKAGLDLIRSEPKQPPTAEPTTSLRS